MAAVHLLRNFTLRATPADARATHRPQILALSPKSDKSAHSHYNSHNNLAGGAR
jgi:hypothetical protein